MGAGMEFYGLDEHSRLVLSHLILLFECDEPIAYERQKDVPWDCPGVYILFSDNQIMYIGQSRNIRHRLYAHQTRCEITHYMVIRCSEGKEQRKALESALIWLLNPRANVGGRRSK